MKLNFTHQDFVYAYDVNILAEDYILQIKALKALVVFSTVIGLEVNADKSKGTVMPRE